MDDQDKPYVCDSKKYFNINMRHYHVISVILSSPHLVSKFHKMTVFTHALRSGHHKRLPVFLFDELSGGLSRHACYKFLHLYF